MKEFKLQLSWGGTNFALGDFHSTQNYGNFSWRSNGTDHLCLGRPEYLRPPLKVVHFDQSGHFIAPFHLTKLLSPLLLSASYAKYAVAWVRSVQLIVSFHSESEISKISIVNFCWIESAHYLIWQSCALAAPGGPWCLHVTFAPRWPDNHMLGILDFIDSEHWALFNFSYSKASYEN